MEGSYTKVLLVSANVGSIFEDVSTPYSHTILPMT